MLRVGGILIEWSAAIKAKVLTEQEETIAVHSAYWSAARHATPIDDNIMSASCESCTRQEPTRTP
eukprot:19929-Amphidinium_carterae.2